MKRRKSKKNKSKISKKNKSKISKKKNIHGGAGIKRLLTLKRAGFREKKKSQVLKYKVQSAIRDLHNNKLIKGLDPPTNNEIKMCKKKTLKLGASKAEIDRAMSFGFKQKKKKAKKQKSQK